MSPKIGKICNMADDEAVIFYNSPLYRHLSEVGFTDFHAETLNNSNERYESISNSSVKHGHGGSIRNLKERVIDSAKRFVSGTLLPSFVSEKMACYSSCVAIIKSSGLLAEDHLGLLYRFEQCIDIAIDSDDNDVHDVFSDRKIENMYKLTEANSSVLLDLVESKYIVGVIMLTALILGVFSNANSYNFFSYILLSILSIWAILKLCSLQLKNKLNILRTNVGLILRYTKFTAKFLMLIRKAILFIQEKELIARGHIIANPAAPVRKLKPQIKQCMMLRKCLFIEMNNFIDLLHKKITISDTKFCADYGNLSWLCKELINIEKGIIIPSEEHLQENDYTLMRLKNVFVTLGRSQSSLLFCTAVNLMLAIICLQESGTSNEILEFNHFDDLLKLGKQFFDHLDHCYNFHKVDIPASIFDENQGHILCAKTVFDSVIMALRSLTIHLQQACKSAVKMEEKVDKLVSVSTQNLAGADLTDVNEQILYIGEEIEKIRVCWRESQHRLEEITFSPCKEKTNIMGEVSGNSVEQDDRHARLFNLTEEAEPVPDQIFEGETTSAHESERQYEPSLGKEELLREEKMREEGRHLLMELKSVLATKDGEKMVGIPRVLLLKKFGTVQGEGKGRNTADFQEIEQNDALPGVELKSCKNAMESCVDDSTDEEQAGIVPSAPNISQSNEQLFPRNEIAENEMTRNQDVVWKPLNDRNVEERVFMGPVCHGANPFASIVATAAAARNIQLGVTEQCYEIEAETFSHHSNTD